MYARAQMHPKHPPILHLETSWAAVHLGSRDVSLHPAPSSLRFLIAPAQGAPGGAATGGQQAEGEQAGDGADPRGWKGCRLQTDTFRWTGSRRQLGVKE